MCKKGSLKERIIILRSQLNDLIRKEQNVDADDLLDLSKKLDELIVLYYEYEKEPGC